MGITTEMKRKGIAMTTKNREVVHTYDEYLRTFFPDRHSDKTELLERDPRALGVELAKRSLSKIDSFQGLLASVRK